MLKLKPAHIAVAFALCATQAAAQEQMNNPRKPATSDAGRPGAPLIPPGKIQPLSGDSIEPIGEDYLGTPPDPMKRGFLTAPGYAPVPRPDDHRPPRPPRGTPLPSGVVVTLPPASTGRQGLPSLTWQLLTSHQQDLHRQAETAAMSSPLGEGFVWNDGGRYGEVRVIADRMFNNRPCRDFGHVVVINGQRVDGTTTICR